MNFYENKRNELCDWLFEDQRIHPKFYDVMVRGNRERTVSIRMGLSWPQPDKPGYYVLVAQLEQTPQDKHLKRTRFLAFQEGESPILQTLFESIGEVCGKKRVDEIKHGDEEGESSFSSMLSDYLRKNGQNYPNIPSVYKSWRCKDINFLVQMVRNYIASRGLLFFNIADNRTPKLIEALRPADWQSDVLKIPEIKALAYVMDDFDVSPWRAPEVVKPGPKPEPWAY